MDKYQQESANFNIKQYTRLLIVHLLDGICEISLQVETSPVESFYPAVLVNSKLDYTALQLCNYIALQLCRPWQTCLTPQ